MSDTTTLTQVVTLEELHKEVAEAYVEGKTLDHQETILHEQLYQVGELIRANRARQSKAWRRLKYAITGEEESQ